MKLKKAFSFLELTVVIMIIILIVGLGVAKLAELKSKSRDVTRLSDVNLIVTALNRYKQDNGYYPSALPFAGALKSPDGLTTYLSPVPDGQKLLMNTSCVGKPYDYFTEDGGFSFKLTYCLETTNDNNAPGPKFARVDKLINSCDCSGQYCGDSDGCGNACNTGLYRQNTDKCVNGTAKCGVNNACVDVTDTCKNGLCSCGGLSACVGGKMCVDGNCVMPHCPVAICGDCSNTPCGSTCYTTVTKDGQAFNETYGTVGVDINGDGRTDGPDECWLTKNIAHVGTMVNVQGATVHLDDSFVDRWCYFDNQNNCDKYGALYAWNEAMYLPASYNNQVFTDYDGLGANAKWQGICPKGWHIPSDREWSLIEDALDPLSIPPGADGSACSASNWGYNADAVCSATNSAYLNNQYGSVTNKTTTGAGAKMVCTDAGAGYFGTSLLGCTAGAGSAIAPKFPFPGYYSGNQFIQLDTYSMLWTSSQNRINGSYVRVKSGNLRLSRNQGSKITGASIRCVKD